MPIYLKNTPPYYEFDNNGGKLPVTILDSTPSVGVSTGGGTPNVIKTIVIPANTLNKKGDLLKIEIVSTTTGVDTKSIEAVIGTSSTLIGSNNITTAGDYRHTTKLMRNNSGDYERRSEGYRALGLYSVSNAGGNQIDWTIENDLVVSVTSTDAGSVAVKSIQVSVESA